MTNINRLRTMYVWIIWYKISVQATLCRTTWWSTGAWWTLWGPTTWATRQSSPTCLRGRYRMDSALTRPPKVSHSFIDFWLERKNNTVNCYTVRKNMNYSFILINVKIFFLGEGGGAAPLLETNTFTPQLLHSFTFYYIKS